jgi:hypothetical protein
MVYFFPAEHSHLDEEKIISLIKEGQQKGSWNHLIRTIGSVYSNPDSLLQSFRFSSGHSKTEPDPDKDVDDTENDNGSPMQVDRSPTIESGHILVNKAPIQVSKTLEQLRIIAWIQLFLCLFVYL